LPLGGVVTLTLMGLAWTLWIAAPARVRAQQAPFHSKYRTKFLPTLGTGNGTEQAQPQSLQLMFRKADGTPVEGVLWLHIESAGKVMDQRYCVASGSVAVGWSGLPLTGLSGTLQVKLLDLNGIQLWGFTTQLTGATSSLALRHTNVELTLP